MGSAPTPPEALQPAPDSIAPAAPPQNVHVFWRRFFAFVVDSIALGLVGALLGALMFDTLVRLGPWGRLIGFSIAFAYLGIANSGVTGGRTLGKRLLGIRVVSPAGGPISIGKSCARALVLLPAYFLNNLQSDALLQHQWLAVVVAIIIFGVGGLTLYLMVFNARTRQGLHDLVAGTYVVRSGGTGAVPVKGVSRKHWIVFAALTAALAAGFFSFAHRFKQDFTNLISIQSAVAGSGDYHATGVRIQWFSSTSGRTTFLLVNTMCYRKPSQEDVDRIARAVLDTDAKAAGAERLTVTVAYGFDLGIASTWLSEGASYTIAEWKERLHIQ